MPTVFFINGMRFFFYSNEGNEPIHIHVEKGGATAKVWIEQAKFERCKRFTSAEQKMIIRIVTLRKEEIIDLWNKFFSGN